MRKSETTTNVNSTQKFSLCATTALICVERQRSIFTMTILCVVGHAEGQIAQQQVARIHHSLFGFLSPTRAKCPARQPRHAEEMRSLGSPSRRPTCRALTCVMAWSVEACATQRKVKAHDSCRPTGVLRFQGRRSRMLAVSPRG